MIFKKFLKMCVELGAGKNPTFRGCSPFKESRVGFCHDHVHSNPCESLVRSALDNTTVSNDDRA